jgi:prepilin-type N-terminal cleavage/methylation domain-containing protein
MNMRTIEPDMSMKEGEPVRGFTLIETLVSIAIIMLATAGPLFSASQALVSAEISRDQLTASYLAQEGIEYVRLVRDNAYLALYPPNTNTSAAAWTNFVNGVISNCSSTACTVDPARSLGVNSSLTPCGTSPNPACAPLYTDNSTHVYGQYSIIPGNVTKTPFTRTIRVTTVSSTEQSVTATVTWSFHNSTYSVTVNNHLTPWQ